MVVAPFKCICEVYQLHPITININQWSSPLGWVAGFSHSSVRWLLVRRILTEGGVMQKQSVPERCPTSLKSIAGVSESCFWGTTIISFGIFSTPGLLPVNIHLFYQEFHGGLSLHRASPSMPWRPHITSRPGSRRSFACSHNSKDWRLSGWSTANKKTWCWE